MRGKLRLISSIILLIFGILGILSFAVLSVSGENMSKWIPALILAISLVIFNLIDIFICKSKRKK